MEWDTFLGSQEELDWQDFALCQEVDSELFFPEEGTSGLDAKKVCRTCDVRKECLEYALENREQHGVWGGMLRKERLYFARTHTAPYSLRQIDIELERNRKKRLRNKD